MLMKRTFFVTCAAIATFATVRSQTSASTPSEVRPAPLFGDALPSSRPAKPEPAPDAPSAKWTPAPAPFAVEAPKPVAPASDAEVRPAPVDESALRYFASQNDLGRVSAEIRRLRAKYPDWEPPQDLFATDHSGVDEQPLWDLFSKHDLAALHARMDEIRASKPDWQPSGDLSGKLALAEAHDQLVSASNAKQWGSVLEIAAANKMLLTCNDVDALWRTAEALARTGDEPRAVEAYRYILANSSQAAIRLATVQKASQVLSGHEALDGLVQMGKRQADGRSEFEQIRLDGMRKRIGDAITTPALAAPSADVEAVASHAAAPDGQADADLLGWYAYARKDFAGARTWFATALKAGPDPKGAEGLVLATRDGGDLTQARKLAIEYAGLGDGNRKLMIEALSAALTDPKAAAPSATELAALTKAVEDAKSSEGAQALGWSFYKANEVATAEEWFRKSADWAPNEAAAIGLVVTARRLHRERDYAALIAKYASTYPRIAELATMLRARPQVAVRVHRDSRPTRVVVARAAGGRGDAPNTNGGAWDASADQIVKTYEAGQYDAAMALLDQRRQRRVEPRGLAVIRGWALYHKGDWENAKQVFSSLDGGGFSREQQEGLRVIQAGYTNPRYR